MATAKPPPPAPQRPRGRQSSFPPLALPLIALPVLVGVYTSHMQEIVPEPYLDEFFHIPQAQKYCAGRFDEWDPKITTPFGLYGLAYILRRFLGIFQPNATGEQLCSVLALRMINTMGVELVLPIVVYKLYRALHPRADKWKAAEIGLVAVTFPLLFFFSGLFYTDVWSTIFVLLGYLYTVKGKIWTAATFSAVSCLFRQTNILWTAFFLVEHLVRFTEKKMEESALIDPNLRGARDPWREVVDNAWENGFLYNPPFKNSSYIALPKALVSFAISLLHRPIPAILHATPYVSVLVGFVIFVVRNGSIACGDKDAHPFTLHFPQLFYFLTFFIFSSWPLFLKPKLLLSFPGSAFPVPFNMTSRDRTSELRRTLFSVGIIGLMLGIVAINTYYHPYLLADNRNFRFYLFRRTLLKYDWAKYAAVLVYFPAGWLLCKSLQHKSIIWVFTYFVAVAGGLVGAGLVEFRYFVLGWVVWRLNLSKETDNSSARRWGEILWFLALDFWSAYVFFNWGFKWEGVDDIQRFMW